MNYLIHPTYVDPATNDLIMKADPLQLTFSVTSAILPGDEFDSIDMANQENMSPQTNRPRGSKRKVTSLEDEENNVPVPSTKRAKRVLKTQKESKKTAEKADSSGADEKLFKCPQCDYSSKKRFNLNTHIKTHDSNRIKEFVCSQCNKVFTRKHDRNRHVANVHT